jgi:WD40 repeat protein
VAISVQALNGQTWQPDGPPQLATYTADGSGNLATKSTFWNMPEHGVKYVTDIWMSPSGKLLAVAGTAGLQVFHFNGSHPMKHYTGLLTKDEVDQLFWDNDNHLFAISRSAAKLFVFTITPTNVSQAPGSPYTITNPQDITVLPKM